MPINLKLQRLWRRLFATGGHGVHSPFAFELLTRVVEERKAVYGAYRVLEEAFHKGSSSLFALPLGQLFYRLIAHYPTQEVLLFGDAPLYLKEQVPILQKAICSCPLVHPYGPYSREDCFVLGYGFDRQRIEELLENRQAAILLIPTYANPSIKRDVLRIFSSCSTGIRIDLPTAQLLVLTPRLLKKHYKSTL